MQEVERSLFTTLRQICLIALYGCSKWQKALEWRPLHKTGCVISFALALPSLRGLPITIGFAAPVVHKPKSKVEDTSNDLKDVSRKSEHTFELNTGPYIRTTMDNQADRSRSYRLIAPRQVDIQQPQTPQAFSADEGKTKRASMACTECKRRRTKCSTGNPCTECLNHKRECVYDINADKRRKEHVASTKQQLDATDNNLRYYYGFLEDLLASIRLGTREQLDDLVHVVQKTTRNTNLENRSGYATIRTAIDAILSETEDAEGSEETSDDDQSMVS